METPDMKKNLFRSGFNLIEVTMAIAIVGIGIAGVMALFPPAIEANKVANNQNYVGMVSDSFLGYLENQVLSDFSKFKSGGSFSSFTSRPATDDLWKNKSSSSIAGFPGLYTVSGHNNVYAVESADGTVTALIALWHNNAAAPDSYSTNANDSRRVYIEASWPAALPYANRTKKLYIYDIFKE